MKGLTSQELYILILSRPGEIPFQVPLVQVEVYERLTERGLLRSWIENFSQFWETTPTGIMLVNIYINYL